MTTPHHDHSVFNIKAGDRLPILEIHLVDCDGNPMDLTPYSTVKLIVAKCVGGRRVVDLALMAKSLPETDGIVTYQWAAGDTDEPGDYNLEVRLTNGTRETSLPAGGYGKVKISPRL